MAKTNFVTMKGFVEYAKVFPQNMDDNMDYHGATEGQYNVNFYPANEEEFAKFFKAGAPESSMGHDTIKLGNAEVGMGKYVKLKRPNKHPSGIEDFGGAPKVFDFREGESTKQWDFDEDGELGNGTEVIVKVSIFGSGPRASIRLEKVAVTDLKVYEGRSEDGVERF